MRKFLVVEDCPVQRNQLESILRGAGHDVRSVDDGLKALEAAQGYQPELIFMDVNMPNQDGFATARELKNDPKTKDIPFAFVTSKGQKADKAWSAILGAKAHISKPYSDAEILAVIN